MAETAPAPATKSSGGFLDGIASKLQSKAEELLHHTGSGTATEDGETPATTGSKREALLNVANIVKDTAGKHLESSKEYLSKVVEQVSTYATDSKEKGLTHVNALSETANVHYASAKESANAYKADLTTNLNKAIAQGQATAAAKAAAKQGSTEATTTEATPTEATTAEETTEATTDGTTTDRALPTEEEPLKFPFNVIAWFVALCHGKGIQTATVSSADGAAAGSTSKDLSVEALQNAAATLTENLSQEAEKAKAAGGKAGADASET